MTNNPHSHFGKLRLAAAAMLLMALAACAAPFKADVSRFQSQLPAPAGQTFAVVAGDPELAGGLEFAQYAGLVRDRLANLGYAPVEDPGKASLIVRFDYGVDNGRERVRSTGFARSPYWSPWYGYSPYYRPYPMGYWGGPWHYGWYDPFFDDGIDVTTVYTSGISLKIDRATDGERVFEGQAEAVSTSNRLQYIVPNLIEAMFTGFPGNSGETVRITVAPEKK
ncbi:DUF4136 domain-containing protein [Novosphingobium mangrovi (ex Huang et al. 2023)]|uniref:DUF4136 domain-containing protein n=1 Tax=Novosphingobium mangrovi (ex Huang et al. 2023) TaxID=2976432 RepID=A0ABT2I2P3_9SPHN|nr:DUF4136 domain-containing protein [Novosphingobium mangrovi (ex Huang et al. 2023)]MCT2399064.1 DUF4136 domain-containing protein [Novosphingobium mangrovi (ex Huang et al. 2023)]